MFHSGDRTMADMGIMVQNLFENKNVLVNTTSMLSGRSQFEPNETTKDRGVASERILFEKKKYRSGQNLQV